MAGTTLNLPLDIPWTVLSASPDMMTQSFGQRGFPTPWRTSLAIAAYEPPDEFQEAIACDQRTALLKITCTLAGYTPTSEEISNGWTFLPPDTVSEVWAVNILGDYFGCYGALVNVSVFPQGGPEGAVARILDFEPKVRDLYQAGTVSGETLSGSAGEVNTTKGWTKTNSTETGLGRTGKWTSSGGDSGGGGSGAGTWELSHYMTGKWGDTQQDSSQTAIDASRERRERWASSTYISQLYSLLTGYHAGTNRAAFLLLPRPHIIPPTNRRTFVQGVRVIEGVQEFFLVVTRPTASDGLCVEVTLDTGHYPEEVTITPKEVPYKTTTFAFNVIRHAESGRWFSGEKVLFEQPYTLPAGFIVDRANVNSDPLHGGMKETDRRDNQQALNSLADYNYGPVSDDTVQVSGSIQGAGGSGPGAWFDRDYEVYARRDVPTPSTADEGRVTSRMLIVARSLATCYVVDEGGCLRTDQDGDEVMEVPWIANEFSVDFPVSATPGDSLGVPPGEIIRNTQRALVAAPLMPSRREPGATTFLASDVFAGRLAPHLSEEVRTQDAVGCREAITVDELLTRSTLELYRKYDMSPAEVAKARLGTLEEISGRSFEAEQE